MAAGWECPALPMLSLPVKESGKATFLAIKPMIAAHYEENPDSFHDEIRQLDQLREAAMRPSRDYNGISVLRRYFSQLHLLRARFPPEAGQLPIDFVWKDMFSNAEYVQEGLQMEQASILYNIAAFHSVLACRSKRDLEQDIKDSITHFQCAAGAFNYLDENLTANQASRDISPPFVTFFKNLMLGQAQECFVEKSLRGTARVKPVNIAKLAVRVSDYYTETVRCLETDPCSLIGKKNKDWLKLLRIKMIFFQALSHYYQGCVCEESGDQGATMAWFALTLKKMGTIGKIPRNLAGDSSVREAVKHFTDYVQAKAAAAKKQNDQVYHERVPELETLEPIAGTDLVRPMMFQPSETQGTDIFGRLVPMRAYEVSSVYSEQKAELMRSITSSVAQKDEELEQFMKTINMGEIEKIHQGIPELPGKVLEQHSGMQGKTPLVKKLHTDLQELMGFSETVTKDLSDIGERKAEDDKEEAEFQAVVGPRPVSQVVATMWKELETMATYHKQGFKSNSDLKTMFDQHYRYMVLLCGPLSSLEAVIPKITPMDAPEEDVRDSERLVGLQAKVQEMTSQRQMLLTQLREQVNSDDITKNLVGHLGTETDSFIEERMKRHKEVAEIIRQNLLAQENILSAVVDANAAKANVRQAVQEVTEQQESMFGSLVQAGKKFLVLQDKIREGLGFYSRLHDSISKLRKRVFDVTGTRAREREAATRSQTSSATPPPTSPSPTPAAAPPRPPKKAELAGNPLGQQQATPTFTDPTPSDMSGSHQIHKTELPQEDISPMTTSASTHLELSSVGSVMSPSNMTTPTPVPLNMEEQLKLLQQQHQLQLQSIGMASIPVGPQSQVPANSGADLSGTEASLVNPATQTEPGSSFSTLGGSVGGSIPYVNPHGSLSHPSLTSPRHSSRGSSEPRERNSASPQVVPSVSSAPLLDFSSEQPSQGAQGPSENQSQALVDLQLLLQPPNNAGVNLATPFNPESQPASSTSLSSGSISTGNTILLNEGSTTVSYSHASPTPTTTVSTCWTQPEAVLDDISASTQNNYSNPISLPADSVNIGNQFSNPTSPSLSESNVLQESVPSENPVNLHQSLGEEVAEESHLPHSPTALHQPTGSNIGGNVTGVTTTINTISRPIPAPVVTPPSSPRESTEPEGSLSMHGQEAGLTGTVREETHKSLNSYNSPVQDGTVEHFNASNEDMADLKTSEDILEFRRESASHSRTSTPHVLQVDSNVEAVNTDLSTLPTMMSLSTSGIVPLSGLDFTPQSTSGIVPLSGLDFTPQLSELPFRSTLPGLASMSLQTPSSISPISLDAGPSNSMVGTPLGGQMEHLHALLASNKTLQQSVDEKARENEQNKATMADQKSQLENYKQQLLILQQQLSQVSFQQQKQEQEKATASGQQAVLMQLLQQQQGMFSQQQAQIEKLSKATELHRHERMDTELKHKQALSVEQERCAGLNTQNLQLNQEMQRLQKQLQSSNQQQHVAQIQLYQLQNQVQERDKHIMAFREQHKHIIQNLEQRHQQKMAQMVQQIQDLQNEIKRAKSQKHSSRPLQSPSSVGGMSPLLPPISAPQQSSSSFMPSPRITPSTPNAKVDLMTPLSARTSPANIHQVPTLQPTKVQSAQLPPITALEAQQTPLGNILKPTKPHMLVGPQQQRVDSPQATADAMNRSLSWNVGQQQPTSQSQSTQQHHGPNPMQPTLPPQGQQKGQPFSGTYQEQGMTTPHSVAGGHQQPQHQPPSQQLAQGLHPQGIQAQQQHLLPQQQQKEAQPPSHPSQQDMSQNIQTPPSGMYQSSQHQRQQQNMPQQPSQQPNILQLQQGLPQQSLSQQHGQQQQGGHQSLHQQQQSVPQLQQSQQQNLPQQLPQQGMPQQGLQQQGPRQTMLQHQQPLQPQSGMLPGMQPLLPQSLEPNSQPQQQASHGVMPAFSQSHSPQTPLPNAQSAPHSMASINHYQMQGPRSSSFPSSGQPARPTQSQVVPNFSQQQPQPQQQQQQQHNQAGAVQQPFQLQPTQAGGPLSQLQHQAPQVNHQVQIPQQPGYQPGMPMNPSFQPPKQ